MENRAYAFAFLGVLGIICLGAYVAASALVDTNGDPLIRFSETSSAPTAIALATRPSGTRTPTPTITPFIPFIPTIIFPTATPTAGPLTPTATETLPPFPTARLLPTRTPTPTEPSTATPNAPPPPNTNTPAPPPPAATNTPVPPPPPPSNFPYRVDGGPAVNRSRNCAGQYYIYGLVRDAQGQALSGVRVRYTSRTVFPPDAVTEAKGYELTVGTSDAEWLVSIVDGNGTPLSPTAAVRLSGLYNGDCWFQLNWRRN